MYKFIKKAFLVGLTVLSYVNPLSTNQLSCISMTNKECKVRLEIINANSDEPAFYPFSIKTSISIKTSKCTNSCNNINPANICWSSRRLEDVFKTCLEDVFNTSSA